MDPTDQTGRRGWSAIHVAMTQNSAAEMCCPVVKGSLIGQVRLVFTLVDIQQRVVPDAIELLRENLLSCRCIVPLTL